MTNPEFVTEAKKNLEERIKKYPLLAGKKIEFYEGEPEPETFNINPGETIKVYVNILEEQCCINTFVSEYHLMVGMLIEEEFLQSSFEIATTWYQPGKNLIQTTIRK